MIGQQPPSRRKRTYRPGTASRWASVRTALSSREGRRGAVATAAAAALVAGVVAPLVATAAPGDVVVVAEDFESATAAAPQGVLVQSGGPTLAQVTEGTNKVLSVTGRANSYDSVSTATGLFEDGVEYTLSAKVKLVDDVAGASARLVGYRGADGTGAYTWVGNTAVSSTAWTTIQGTYTLPAGAVPANAKVTVEVSTESAFPSFLLDDVRITKPGPTGPEAVLASDFETGTAPWVARGDANVTVERTTTAARSGTGSLLVSGRSANWHGVQTPINGLFVEGATYDVSAWVRLAPGQDDTTLKFSVAEQPQAFVQVNAPVTVTDDAWVQLSGTYTRNAGVTGGDLYIEAASATASFLVDDVVITGPPAGGGEGPDPSVVPGGAVNPTTTPVTAARGTGKVAALTFDDGPNPGETEDLLDFLAEKDVTATFCVIGQNIEAPGGAAILQRIVREGHTLCNHSTGYADMAAMTEEQVRTDLVRNLEIIRTALGDPQAQVPYFRAPNGNWGRTQAVAVSLGMQPLGVVNTINDWATQDEATLTANLREAVQEGQIVLVHDGGGDRAGSVAATRTVVTELLEDDWTFTLPAGGPAEQPTGGSVSADFEDGTLQGWGPRDAGSGAPTVEVVDEGHESDHAARISDRASQGSGLQHPVAGVLTEGAQYEVSAWIRFEGEPGEVTLSYRQVQGGAEKFGPLVSFTQVPGTDWTQVTGSFTLPAGTQDIYFETAWEGDGVPGNTSTFLVDDIVVDEVDFVVQDLTPLKDTLDVPAGVAVDPRETLGGPAQLTLKHFDQISPENHMKPYAWYDADKNFAPSAEGDALMAFAQDNGLRVYGHVLVWHSQNAGQNDDPNQGRVTPGWMFEDAQGNELTSSAADRAILRERLRTHIFAVAEHLATTYGEFGSESNPLVAWDVVNEVVDDGAAYEDGLRRSAWYRILGEEFIDLAFRYADEAFNEEYAAAGTDRPVKLFINDYNTEQEGKQQRYYDLVQRLLERDVPIDGVGHQFHVSLAMPVDALEAAIRKFQGLGLDQVVTELDVTTGTPESEAKFIEQGYYYRDAFRMFRQYEDDLFSVTVWGLTDVRSWRDSSGGPLLFDDDGTAKPAYYGAVDEELPARVRTANVFAGDVALDDEATSSLEWEKLPLHAIESKAEFQLRWAADHLTAYVTVKDGSEQPTDGLTFVVGDEEYAFGRDGEGDVEGVVTEHEGGWSAVVHLPLSGATQGSTLQFDVAVTDGGTTAGWNTPGVLGTLSLLEPLSYVEVARAAATPQIDGEADAAWAEAAVVRTDKQVEGTAGATAEVRTLWEGDTVYVLADVTDPVVDLSGSDPWIKDSVEIYVDAGNAKNAGYRYEDMQIRINADNGVSFGAGGTETYQRNRVTSATTRTATGYRVEAAITLDDRGGLGTFHGLDFQVNDASSGVRTGIRNWADPSGQGYQSPARWGVGRLVEAVDEPGGNPGENPSSKPTISLSAAQVRAGGQVDVALAGFEAGQKVAVSLGAGATARAGAAVAAPAGSTLLGTVTVAADGTATLRVTVPASTQAGVYLLQASDGSTVLASTSLTVLAAQGGTGAGPGGLAVTGTGIGIGVLALLVLAAGVALVVARKRGMLTRP
ncbi:endo-1,4-beta-xylanase [Cellulomonas sp. JZ18]|uniref:endo-1,4-beta-xylanase n=1 Tax=Cellulomonas sp. JZ18 TaxID=2654191 RepID=UPI0018AFC3A3|nr:endo-1,4-beta-xylanase [Cellulomonas sp. JZ18]